ncbi:MAG: GntR family transcriptional regulator [Pseudomonadota bacterium]
MTGLDTPTTQTQAAAEALREMIFEGSLAPGSDHLESELAALLGMSRTPVREAALILQVQGLVTVRPRRGLRVLPVAPEDMREVYAVLTELEALAAEQAAQQAYSTDALATLRAAIDAMDAALVAPDLAAWAQADAAFHRELVRLGGNQRVQQIVDMMNDQVRRAKMVTLQLRTLPTASNEDHRAVLEAIAKGDAKTARACHRQHRERAGEELLGLLQRHKLAQL